MPSSDFVEREVYMALFYQHETLKSNYKALQAQIEDKEAAWKAQKKKTKDTEYAVKQFFKKILSNDRDELQKSYGKEYSWDSFSLIELLHLTEASYDKQNDEVTEASRKLQALSAEQNAIIENLQTQLAQKSSELKHAQSSGEFSTSISEQSVAEIIGEGDCEAPPADIPEATMNRMNYHYQQAAASGGVNIQIDEADEDITPYEVADAASHAVTGDVIRAKKGGIQISGSRMMQQAIATERRKQTEFLISTIEEVEANMDARKWAILQYIGETGVSQITELIEKIQIKKENSDEVYGPTTIRSLVNQMVNMQILNCEDIGIPTSTGVLKLIWIPERMLGLYKKHFKKDPVECERAKVIKMHDNPTHGYGVIELAKVLQSKGIFTSVEHERSKVEVKIAHDRSYVPDVRTVKSRKGQLDKVDYFEYERVYHNTENWCIKLNKMAKATTHMYLVTASKKSATALKNKTDTWIESRGGVGCLPEHTVYITTVKKIAEADNIFADDVWEYIIPLGKPGQAAPENQPAKKPALEQGNAQPMPSQNTPPLRPADNSQYLPGGQIV